MVAEALGTGLLVVAIVGSGIMASRLAPGEPALMLLGSTVATVGALVALILALGAVSGAHLNPAVTSLGRLGGSCGTRQAAAYVGAQVVGGCLGASAANVMFGLPAVQVAAQRRSSGGLWLSEVVATAGLLLVIEGCGRSGRRAAIPYAVAAWVGGAYWFTASTGFANPAVTVARTLSDSFAGIAPTSALVFVLMQCVGVAVAFGLARLIFVEPVDHRISFDEDGGGGRVS